MASVCTCLWYPSGAEEAARFYVDLLPESRILKIHPLHGAGKQADPFLVEFQLKGQRYIAMNGGPHYHLSPAVSIQILAEGQGEIDRLWSALSDGGTPLRCGWLTDRWGLSWQIVPTALPRLLAEGDAVAARVLLTMQDMVKLDVAALEAAAREPALP
ncbi:VOC family protein [Albidovulum sediminis]|uniref:VOC family protein n=1 Tax=Albidovulum sediminis TaxID=3066345 RepID=A0ABT2NJP0_9RHOB|nr:VOC family protein [Defluviimonas sediminis]MCT8329138.1 VOC family protein [Defluviimonas sediminis]